MLLLVQKRMSKPVLITGQSVWVPHGRCAGALYESPLPNTIRTTPSAMRHRHAVI